MRYRNIVSGAVIETDCKVSGENWVEETPPKQPAEKKGRVKDGRKLRDN